MSFDPEPYQLVQALLHWGLVFGSLVAIVLIVTLLTLLTTFGKRAFALIGQQLSDGVRDIASLSPRRIVALSTLTIKESLRRKVLLVGVVFAILFMFAGWFLSDTNARADLQVKVYVSFVLTAISWLTLPVVLLLSCWGLPNDIKARSLHTVVTKPVRRIEVVLGRICGFVAVGTLILVVMGTVGYIWIQRQVPESARDQLVSRVPVYGQLSFKDREGNDAAEGVNTGDIWEFRSYVEGATRARAIWEFDNVTPARTGEPLALEARFESFRTHKGEMGVGLLCQFEFVNEANGLRIAHDAFEVQEFSENIIPIERELSFYDDDAQEWKTVDLYNDLVHDGKLRVEAMCLDAGQYLGMARPDLFIRTPDKPFASGFFKALFGIWLMTVLIIVLGVTASCFVKGPVATLLTFTLIIIGQGFREFMEKIVGGDVGGGGPLESAYRMVKHMNPTVEIQDGGPFISIMQAIDSVFLHGVWLIQQLVPNFGYYRMAPYVANGFDVNWEAALLPSIAVTLAYFIPCVLIGYYSLKLRELEAK